ncbi:MAG: hypothetical protein KGI26_07345, partial [Thaumarchaeota archaeon]|nr:hypothetical protein [Nitrososphaerota archaeon]
MRLTGRGKKVFAAFALLLGAGATFVDAFLLAAAAAAAALMIFDAFDCYLVAARSGSFSFEPSGFEGRMLRGKSREFRSVVRAARPVTFDLTSVGWLRAPVVSFSAGSWPFDFTLASELSGT